MVDVIEVGEWPPALETKRIRCGYCQSLLEYTVRDVYRRTVHVGYPVGRTREFIKCSVCKRPWPVDG